MGITNSRDDTERYRLGYPDLKDDPNLTSNIRFYKNEIKSVPDGKYLVFTNHISRIITENYWII